uniref:PHD-type domain-containing protein n=1 Tax=Gallus gallus TaxID=9031 RepID=A0A8V0XWW7_CHICK
ARKIKEKGPGDGPQGHPALPGAHRCSRLLSPSSPVCVLCRRAQVNPDICGQTFANDGLCAHQFCLFFANGLLEWRSPMGGIFGFSINAVQRTVQLAEQKNCFVCGGRGAAITCAETGCERSFHLPCTEDGESSPQAAGARMEHQSRASCSLPWLSSSSQPQPIC